jgi:FAD/FMN-containing dehydrogenase
MTVDATALAALTAELPAGTVLGRDDDLAVYETPWRGPAGRAAFVALPADLDQLRTVVRWAVRHRVPLVPQGANTGLVGASVPGPDAVAGVLSTARLTAPLDLHADDRAVTAAAGVLLSQVQAAAAPHGLELPIDLSSDPSVGGWWPPMPAAAGCCGTATSGTDCSASRSCWPTRTPRCSVTFARCGRRTTRRG